MAITNHERVGKALDLLKAGLGPFVDREVKGALESRKLDAFKLRDYAEDPVLANKPVTEWDVAGLLKLMWETWNDVFRTILGPAERSLVGELRGHRNKWAHQESFSSDDAYRALDSVGRLLAAVSAPQSDELERLKMELLRVRFDEQARGERRRQAGTAVGSAVATGLKPWREIVTPHKDVASGRYQQAEFAADLWQVHLGEGTDEYRDPVEFFRRTYLTESLKGLLVGAVRRLAGRGGDPVVQLQTNFGGGKTHSMLALYHLFSGTAPGDLAGIDAVLQEAQATELGTARRVVLVGNKISPGNPVTKGGRHGRSNPLGRAGVATGRQEGIRPDCSRRREGDESGRCTARALQRIRPLPHPHRRVGGLRPPTARPERPSRRQLRDPVQLCPGADGIRQARQPLSARDQPAGLGYCRVSPHPGR